MQLFLKVVPNYSKKPVLIFPKLTQTLKGNKDYLYFYLKATTLHMNDMSLSLNIQITH